jgi:hypothetical protein
LVEEEADKSLCWMELIVEVGLLPLEKVINLMLENTEILAMTVASIKTLRNKSKIQNLKYERNCINQNFM